MVNHIIHSNPHDEPKFESKLRCWNHSNFPVSRRFMLASKADPCNLNDLNDILVVKSCNVHNTACHVMLKHQNNWKFTCDHYWSETQTHFQLEWQFYANNLTAKHQSNSINQWGEPVNLSYPPWVFLQLKKYYEICSSSHLNRLLSKINVVPKTNLFPKYHMSKHCKTYVKWDTKKHTQ